MTGESYTVLRLILMCKLLMCLMRTVSAASVLKVFKIGDQKTKREIIQTLVKLKKKKFNNYDFEEQPKQ